LTIITEKKGGDMKAWENVLMPPIGGRSQKPRQTGITMVIDKGLGIEATKDLIQLSGEFIDIIKLTFGTSAFYDEKLLKEKNKLITSAGIDVMPGGTFLEVAVWKNVYNEYLKRAKELGFTAIEISDGTIEIDLQKRREIIRKAIASGFKVISEVGKKDPNEKIAIEFMHKEIINDLEEGVFKVIVEAREAGRGVGIYDKEGKIKEDEVDRIISGIEDVNSLIWEAPNKNQQQYLVLRFGINVNLGNIPPEEILALEALRQGLRGDTLKKIYIESKEID
jgi:phosphosulfolactate synthase